MRFRTIEARKKHYVLRRSGFRRVAPALCAFAALAVMPAWMASAASSNVSSPAVIQIPASIGALSIKPATLIAAAHGPSVLGATARRTGAIVSYGIFNVASTTFSVARALPGRRRGHRCVAATSRNVRDKRCTRYLNVGSFTHADALALGNLHFRFLGRVRGHALTPGPYRMRAVPTSAGGIVGKPVFGLFTVAR